MSRRNGRAGMRITVLACALGGALLLGGCSSLNPANWFADKPKPAELEDLAPKIAGHEVWHAQFDSVKFPMSVAVIDGGVVAAGTDGTVLALSADDGHVLWRGNVDASLSAGVGSDGRLAAVVTRDNELVVLDGGSVKWRASLRSRVVTAPLVAGERVFVMGVDRVVQAYDAVDGHLMWRLQRPGEALTLAQPGVVAPFKNTLLVGQGPTLAGVDPLNGVVQWEVAIATPRGTNEVERLADLVGPLVRAGDVVCARAFQAAVGCANAEQAKLLWSKNVGGINAVGGDDELVFGADASDRMTAWRTANGDVAWTNERFLNRELSGLLSAGKVVVAGDFQGYVHFLARDTGETLLRLPTDGSAIVGAPVRSGNTIVVTTRGGGLYAFRLE